MRRRLRRDDDYLNSGKPSCDYDDRAAREALVDALAGDTNALLVALDGEPCERSLAEAAELLASLVGQDLEETGATLRIKVQPPVAPGGRFSKTAFAIDLAAASVICPAGIVVPRRPSGEGRVASFGGACASCPLVERCTTAKRGRSISVGPHEVQPASARLAGHDPTWKTDYRATRPRVERKIGRLMRRRHGGRRARVRGLTKVAADLSLLAAAVDLARLGVLGLLRHGTSWAVRAT